METDNAYVSDVFTAWARFPFKEPTKDYGYKKSGIIYSYIKANVKTIFYKHLYNQHVNQMKDILNDNQILFYNCFVRKSNITALHFTLYYEIIPAVDAHWKK